MARVRKDSDDAEDPPMNIIKESPFFVVLTVLALTFFILIQPNAGITFADERVNLPTATFQTPRAAQTGTPGPNLPKSPKLPQGPKAPESPEGSFGNSGINSPQGAVLNGPQRPIR